MLPADRRLRRSQDFRRAVRRGNRVGSRMLVVHLYDVARDPSAEQVDAGAAPARIGFVVGRGVGGSVVRSQVSRRLRHVMRARLELIPDGTLLVVRALAPAASATSAVLAAELDGALRRLGLAPAAPAVALGSPA